MFTHRLSLLLVATQSRCGGIFNNDSIANLLSSRPMKQFLSGWHLRKLRAKLNCLDFLTHSVYLPIYSVLKGLDCCYIFKLQCWLISIIFGTQNQQRIANVHICSLQILSTNSDALVIKTILFIRTE